MGTSASMSHRLTWCLSASCYGAAVLESSMMRWSGRCPAAEGKGSCPRVMVDSLRRLLGDWRVGEEKVLTLRQQLSFRGQSLCLPVIQGAVKELFSKVVSPLHPVCTCKWFCFQLQG